MTPVLAAARDLQNAFPLLRSNYAPRLSNAAEFARANRVLLLQTHTGVPIDIALGALPFEEALVERSTFFDFGAACELRTCSAEDLVLKLFAFRARDLLDAESVAARQGNSLDWEYIERSLGPLAEVKEQPEIMDALRKLQARF